MIKGKLEAFWETGTEGVLWAVYMDGKSGYEALHYLNENDYITIYNENEEIIYEGDIIEDRFSNWYPYYMNPLFGQQSAGCYAVHWIQANVEPDKWCEWFNQSLRVKVTKSKLAKKKKEVIKKEIIKDYYKNRKFSDVIYEKSKLKIDLKTPSWYGETGIKAVGSMLFGAENKYQIFEDQYCTLVIVENYNDKLKEITEKDLTFENCVEVDLILNEEEKDLERYQDFDKKHIRGNYSHHLDIMFGKVEDEIYVKELDKLSSKYQKIKEKMSERFLEILNNIPTYKIGEFEVKMVKFSKNTTKYLRKDKSIE